MDDHSKQTTKPGTRLFNVLLGEVFLGFLAIVAATLTLIPILFTTSSGAEAGIEVFQWSIVALFGIEYAVGFSRTTRKIGFMLNPWRVVDAVTILLPLATLLPGMSQALRSTPVLRLIRLARVVALGARASGVMVREEKVAAGSNVAPPIQVRVLPASGAAARSATWEEFVRWAADPGYEWYNLANIGPHNLAQLGKATGISQAFIATHFIGNTYPHVETTARFLSLFVWLPERAADQHIERNGLLLLASDKSVVTFCQRQARLIESISAPVREDLAKLPFPLKVICQFLKTVLDANENLVGDFEQALGKLEELPVRESRQFFFEQTFRLKKELSAAQTDLWRLRGVLKELAEGRSKLPGASVEVPFFRDLSERADYLYETVNNIREGVLSLIELHLNVVSFEMNRVMRVLAVVSVLGLIPAVIGGLFGMNLADNPWPFTLPQVTFAVGTGMVTCLYFFVMKGWLR